MRAGARRFHFRRCFAGAAAHILGSPKPTVIRQNHHFRRFLFFTRHASPLPPRPAMIMLTRLPDRQQLNRTRQALPTPTPSTPLLADTPTAAMPARSTPTHALPAPRHHIHHQVTPTPAAPPPHHRRFEKMMTIRYVLAHVVYDAARFSY